MRRRDNVLAVGWLSPEHSFSQGPNDVVVYDRLKSLCQEPWQPFSYMGYHSCELCQFEGAQGSSNLFIPYEGTLFVAPELILHYINTHHYQPPEVFCDAVVNCPEMRTMAYRKEIAACGGKELFQLD